ncbi:MAG: hypothetical protein VXY16_08410 [Pseudomonadota bacterium]|nr:hypothetical protein [Pseudomonadota bacterium]
MRGNAGGGFGGGFGAGYMAAKHPEGVAVALVLALIAGGVYGVANQMDKPHRVPLVDDIIATSVEECRNAFNDASRYEEGMRSELMTVWSSALEEFQQSADGMVICEDEALGQFVMPYERNEVGKIYTGEYRIIGVMYTNANGERAMVIKPRDLPMAENSIDSEPDRQISTSDTLEAFSSAPSEAQTFEMADGTTVSVYLQHDGIWQNEGSSTTHDNDGKGWADAERMEQILEHYQFSWPIYSGSTYGSNTVPTLTAPSPA